MTPSSVSQSAAWHGPRAPWGDTRREFSEGVDERGDPVLVVLWLVSPGSLLVTAGKAAQALWPWGEVVAGRYPAMREWPSCRPTGEPSGPGREGPAASDMTGFVPDGTMLSHTWDRASNRTWWQWETEPQTQSDCHAVPCPPTVFSEQPGPSPQLNTRSFWCPEMHESGWGGDTPHKARPGSEETLEGEPTPSRPRATVSVAVPGLHPFPVTPGGEASLQLCYPVLGTGCPRVEAGGAPGELGPQLADHVTSD